MANSQTYAERQILSVIESIVKKIKAAESHVDYSDQMGSMMRICSCANEVVSEWNSLSSYFSAMLPSQINDLRLEWIDGRILPAIKWQEEFSTWVGHAQSYASLFADGLGKYLRNPEKETDVYVPLDGEKITYKYNLSGRKLQVHKEGRCIAEDDIDKVYKYFYPYDNLSDWDVVKKMARRNNQGVIEIRTCDYSGKFHTYAYLDVLTGEFNHVVG